MKKDEKVIEEKVNPSQNKNGFIHEKSPAPSHVREEDLTIDENIDDKYTNKVLNKYKYGKVKNLWFFASAVISIVFGIACLFSMLIIAWHYLINGAVTNASERSKIVIITIVFSVCGLISILVGMKVASFSNFKKEQCNAHLGEIIAMGLLQFFFSGVIVVIFTIIGYFSGISSDYGVIFYNRLDSSGKLKRLADAKVLYQNRLIDYAEYKALKKKILSSTSFEELDGIIGDDVISNEDESFDDDFSGEQTLENEEEKAIINLKEGKK